MQSEISDPSNCDPINKARNSKKGTVQKQFEGQKSQIKNANDWAEQCQKEDLLVVSREEAGNNFRLFIQATEHIVETPETLEQFDKYYKLDTSNWPTLDEAKQLFQTNLVDLRSRCKKWSEVDKRLFYWVVVRYSLANNLLDRKDQEQWREIARLIVGRNAHQCRTKWQQKFRVVLSQQPWTEEEDRMLLKVHMQFSLIDQKGIRQIGQVKQMESNCEGCQGRYFLENPSLAQTMSRKVDQQTRPEYFKVCLLFCNRSVPWSKEQELLLLRRIMTQGKRWADLSKQFNFQRSENFLKNRYHILIKKEKHKQNLDKLDGKLFEKIQEFRQVEGQGIMIDEIDHYEWQYIVLAIQRIEKELKIESKELKENKELKQTPELEDEIEQSLAKKRILTISSLGHKQLSGSFHLIDIKNKKVYDLGLTDQLISNFISQLPNSNRATLQQLSQNSLGLQSVPLQKGSQQLQASTTQVNRNIHSQPYDSLLIPQVQSRNLNISQIVPNMQTIESQNLGRYIVHGHPLQQNIMSQNMNFFFGNSHDQFYLPPPPIQPQYNKHFNLLRMWMYPHTIANEIMQNQWQIQKSNEIFQQQQNRSQQVQAQAEQAQASGKFDLLGIRFIGDSEDDEK